ncbi:TetR/AcrR family transcriptional regulator [Carboxylicivirga linearis]|uniref:TetR/AcrR family transcriptional regulator n=1 Tax=Carboxylicivirga linearis TaxID=1628157 RepID=A0ABS5JYM8_9BACT|nr:TetR/AcrR family transcriptional regulator [Carboxylicivirga linearis]MBS2099966.1 TetR/AcrR family transcriptional regulator [Carboxylicivirga linearis]
MNTKPLTFQKWLEAAYKEFACYGPDFSLKALSGKAGLPRATFYYHFNNKEHLTEELLVYHCKVAEQFSNELKREVSELIPDLYEVMFRYKLNVRFHQQLLRNNHVEAFQNVYTRINTCSIEILLPFIRKYFNSDKSNVDLIEFFNTLTGAWYARINFKNCTVEYMCNLAIEIMEHTLGLYNHPKVKSL